VMKQPVGGFLKEKDVMKNKVFIVLFVVVLVGYAGYCALAQYEFSQGQAAFKAQDWLTAWMRLNGWVDINLPCLRIQVRSGIEKIRAVF